MATHGSLLQGLISFWFGYFVELLESLNKAAITINLPGTEAALSLPPLRAT